MIHDKLPVFILTAIVKHFRPVFTQPLVPHPHFGIFRVHSFSI